MSTYALETFKYVLKLFTFIILPFVTNQQYYRTIKTVHSGKIRKIVNCDCLGAFASL